MNQRRHDKGTARRVAPVPLFGATVTDLITQESFIIEQPALFTDDAE